MDEGDLNLRPLAPRDRADGPGVGSMPAAETLRAVLDSLAGPVIGCARDGTPLWMNDAARQAFGAAPGGGAFDAWGPCRHADGRLLDRAEHPLQRALAGETVRGARVMAHPPGAAPRFFVANAAPVESGGARCGAVLVLHDETTRVLGTRLKECEFRVADLLAQPLPLEDVMPDVMATIGTAMEWAAAEFWSVDGVGGVLRRMACWTSGNRTLGCELPHVIACEQGLAGRAWRTAEPEWAPDLRTHPDSAAYVSDWAELRSGLAIPVPSGTTVLAVMTFYSDTPQTDNDTRLAVLSGIAATVGEFLERRRAERLDAELDQTREEYIALIGHEVRTPLTSIESSIDLMLAHADLGPTERGEMLGVIQRNAKSLHVLVHKLLDVAAIRSGASTIDRRPLDLSRLCADAATDARASLTEDSVQVDLNIPDGVTVEGDAARLRQVVDELLAAAVVGAPPGAVIGLNLHGEGPTTVLTVSRAVPVERRPQKPAVAPGAGVPGTALGITHVRTVVHAHGGALSLRDTADPVDVFTVRLPTCAPRD